MGCEFSNLKKGIILNAETAQVQACTGLLLPGLAGQPFRGDDIRVLVILHLFVFDSILWRAVTELPLSMFIFPAIDPVMAYACRQNLIRLSFEPGTVGWGLIDINTATC